MDSIEINIIIMPIHNKIPIIPITKPAVAIVDSSSLVLPMAPRTMPTIFVISLGV